MVITGGSSAKGLRSALVAEQRVACFTDGNLHRGAPSIFRPWKPSATESALALTFKCGQLFTDLGRRRDERQVLSKLDWRRLLQVSGCGDSPSLFTNLTLIAHVFVVDKHPEHRRHVTRSARIRKFCPRSKGAKIEDYAACCADSLCA